MTTKRLIFQRIGDPVQSILPVMTDRDRVIAHLVERYAISEEEAAQRYACWDVINNIRGNLGIKG